MERTITVPVTLPENALAGKSHEREPMPKRLNYTRRQAADALGISLVTLDAYMRRAENPLPFIRCGSRKILIPVQSLQKWNADEANRCSGIDMRR